MTTPTSTHTRNTKDGAFMAKGEDEDEFTYGDGDGTGKAHWTERLEDAVEDAVEGVFERGEDQADDDAPPEAGDADTSDGEGGGGGYVASSGGGSYAGDIAMMRSEAEYTENTVMPHYELLISQAETAGNGPKTVQALRAGLDAARSSLGAARDAIAEVQRTSEHVQAAYDDAGGEAAKSKSYFHGD